MADVVRVDSPTEGRNPRTVGIDRSPALDVLRALNAEDATVPAAVAAALPELARAVELVVAGLGADNRVHCVGAGTSGRLAELDAEELGPTYDLEPGRWLVHLAPPEGSAGGEDDAVAGAAVAAAIAAGDVVVGVTASGRTPFVVAALAAAVERGARTVLVSSNPGAEWGGRVDVHVCTDTGPEAVTGSTRLKAGTAQKLVLNGLSTASMVLLGRTWSNLMVGLQATNGKLRGRLAAALAEATGEPDTTCAAALAESDGDGRVALLSVLTGVPVQVARSALAAAGGSVRVALDGLANGSGAVQLG